jgi:hypothetical protein
MRNSKAFHSDQHERQWGASFSLFDFELIAVVVSASSDLGTPKEGESHAPG